MHHGVNTFSPPPFHDLTPLVAAPYKIIAEDGKVFDIDKDDTDRW